MPTPHHTAAILAIGDELTLGQKLDTNSQWLSDRLTTLGIEVVEHATVADDLDRLVETIARLMTAADLLVITGGLGPTDDDLTRRAIAAAAGQPLVEDAAALAQVRAWFDSRGIDMPRANRVQALRPEAAVTLTNPNGTAPGLWLPNPGSTALQAVSLPFADTLALPGPPSEMRPMFDRVCPQRLRPDPARAIHTRALPTFGLGESTIAQRLGPLLDRARNPLVGTTASGGIVTIRIRLDAEPDAHRAQQQLDETEHLIRTGLPPIVLASSPRDPEDDPLVAGVSGLLRAHNQTVAVVESCTGGLLGQMLTSVPGSSALFAGGLITYTNRLKAQLAGVDPELIENHGAVSEHTARAMGEGGLAALGSDHALGITGIAGPDGGTPDKPVGTVWIALSSRDAPTDVRCFRFLGGRGAIRRWAARSALGMLRLRLLGVDMGLALQVSPPSNDKP